MTPGGSDVRVRPGSPSPEEGASTFPGFLAKALLVVGAVAIVTAWPAYALAGPDGLAALALAALVSLLGAVLGRAPRLVFRHGPDALFHAAMAGLGLRLLGTLALAAPVMLFAGLPTIPFALGLVPTYLALLVLEVRDLVVRSRTLVAGEPCPPGPEGAPTR